MHCIIFNLILFRTAKMHEYFIQCDDHNSFVNLILRIIIAAWCYLYGNQNLDLVVAVESTIF